LRLTPFIATSAGDFFFFFFFRRIRAASAERRLQPDSSQRFKMPPATADTTLSLLDDADSAEDTTPFRQPLRFRRMMFSPMMPLIASPRRMLPKMAAAAAAAP